MTLALSSEDRRLLTRAGYLLIYLWAAMFVVFTAATILPAVNTGGSALSQSAILLGPAVLGGTVFSALLAGASTLLPERPPSPAMKLMLGFVGLGIGITALTEGAAILLAAATVSLLDETSVWILAVLLLVSLVLAVPFLRHGYRRIREQLSAPSRSPPRGPGG